MAGRYKRPLKKKRQKISRVDIINQVPEPLSVIKKTRLQRFNEWCDLNPTNCQVLAAVGGLGLVAGGVYGDYKLTKHSRLYRNVIKRPYQRNKNVHTLNQIDNARAKLEYYDQLDREQEARNKSRFGKHRKRTIPKSIIKTCRRLKIRLCIKQGGKRRYKTLRRIKKEIKNKIKKQK